jgi:hypothetical protein
MDTIEVLIDDVKCNDVKCNDSKCNDVKCNNVKCTDSKCNYAKCTDSKCTDSKCFKETNLNLVNSKLDHNLTSPSFLFNKHKKLEKRHLSMEEIPILNIENGINKELCLLKQYLFRVKIKAKSHELAKKWYHRVNRIMGFPPILLATISSILGGIDVSNKSMQRDHKVVLLFLSSTILLFTSLTTYLNYGKRSSNHHDSSLRYNTSKSDIELFLTTKFTYDQLEHFLTNQHEKIDIYETLEPDINDRFINGVKRKILKY